VKTTQYVRQSSAIAAADSGGIRERWMWGLRLLRDPDAFNPGSSQLRPGRADVLIAAHATRGIKLSTTEIRYRLQCARAYPTEAEFATACGEFGSWSDLRNAGFPTYEAPLGEPLADHRTPEEVRRDRARQLTDITNPQGALFPLSHFEPITATLKELQEYAQEQAELTARFVAHDDKRRAYLAELVQAADGDLSMTWQEAHDRLPHDDEPDEQTAEASA
jgi:hypothetical protein